METDPTLQWPYLAAALAALLFPRQWLRLGKIFKRHRKQRETLDKFSQDGGNDPDDKSVKLGRELANKRNYLDFLRALAGGWALWHFSFTASTADGRLLIIAIGSGISVVGTAIQSVRWNGKVTFFAPIFYLAGLSIAMGNPYSGVFALLLVCAINPVIPNPRLFLTAYALLLLPFDFLFGEDMVRSLANAVLVLLVPMASLLAGRPVVIFSKKTTG